MNYSIQDYWPDATINNTYDSYVTLIKPLKYLIKMIHETLSK